MEIKRLVHERFEDLLCGRLMRYVRETKGEEEFERNEKNITSLKNFFFFLLENPEVKWTLTFFEEAGETCRFIATSNGEVIPGDDGKKLRKLEQISEVDFFVPFALVRSEVFPTASFFGAFWSELGKIFDFSRKNIKYPFSYDYAFRFFLRVK